MAKAVNIKKYSHRKEIAMGGFAQDGIACQNLEGTNQDLSILEKMISFRLN